MSEDYIVDSYEMKIHKLLIYYLNILTLILIYIYKQLIKLLILISLISFIVYIIIEYNLEEKIYYDIYIPYFEYYK